MDKDGIQKAGLIAASMTIISTGVTLVTTDGNKVYVGLALILIGTGTALLREYLKR